MKYRYAMNTNRQLTRCTSTPENFGKGRCNHIDHQREDEELSDFMQRMAPMSVFTHPIHMKHKIIGDRYRPKMKYHEVYKLKDETPILMELYTDLTPSKRGLYSFKRESDHSFFTLKVNNKIILRTNNKRRFLNLFFPDMKDARMKPSLPQDFPQVDAKQIFNYLLGNDYLKAESVPDDKYDFNYKEIIENNLKNY